MKTTALAAALAALLGTATGVRADPSFGFGVTLIFGGDVAVGVKVFSDDDPDSAAASIGLDYKFRSGSVRPNVGVAWLDDDWWADANVGYDLGSRSVDFGVGVGGLCCTDDDDDDDDDGTPVVVDTNGPPPT